MESKLFEELRDNLKTALKDIREERPMYVTYDYKCLGHPTVTRMVRRGDEDEQYCHRTHLHTPGERIVPMKRLMPAPGTTFKFADRSARKCSRS